MISKVQVEKDAREGFYRLILTNWDMAGESKIELLCNSSVLGYLRAACDTELRAIQPKPPIPSKKTCAHCNGSGKRFVFEELCDYCGGTGYEPTYLSEIEDKNESD